MEEECQQLDEVVEHVGVLLLHPDDVGWVVRLVLVQFHILVPGEEPKLEEVLDHNGHLHRWEKISPKYSLEGLVLKLKLQIFGNLM